MNTQQRADIADLRSDYHGMLMQIVRLCPEGRERDQAIARLEESAMWAVKAITHEGS